MKYVNTSDVGGLRSGIGRGRLLLWNLVSFAQLSYSAQA